jgi:hypothetical protein
VEPDVGKPYLKAANGRRHGGAKHGLDVLLTDLRDDRDVLLINMNHTLYFPPRA